MATNYNGSLTRQHPVNMNNEVLSSTSNTDSNELRDKVKILVNELKTNTVDSPHHYGWLHLRITDLSVKECEAIVEGLEMNAGNVTWLDISPINISFQGLACIIDTLQTNTRITELHLSGKPDNDLFDETGDENYLITIPAKSLAQVLKVNKTIHNLTIANSHLSDDDMRTIVNGLKLNITLTELHLKANPELTVQSVFYLQKLVESTRTIREIRLDEIPNVDDNWIVSIGYALKINESIQTLIMHSCQIGDKGAAIFGEMLTVNHTLKRLSLHDTLITDIGAKSLAVGLKQN